jgi:hypothetical protein
MLVDNLLEIAYMVADEHKEVLALLKEKWGGRPYGIHEWFRIELMVKLWQNGWNAKSYSEGKGRPIGPDLVIEDMLVELRPVLDYNVGYIRNGFDKTPRPHHVLFLALSSEKFLRRLKELKQKGFDVKINKLESSDWIIGVISEAI